MSDGAADAIVARYRRELRAAADIARGDLDEIEDHLRALIHDLRARGLPAAEAIAEAGRRLGEPGVIAREHARVRGAFGAPLSPLRARSAALCLAVPVVSFGYILVRFASHVPAIANFGTYLNLALGAIMVAGLLAGLGWARAFALGAQPLALLSALGWLAMGDLRFTPIVGVLVAANAGALAFLLPWRRCELTAGGLALALLAVAYTGASYELSTSLASDGASAFRDPVAVCAWLGVLAAGAGGLVRARWAAIPAAMTTLATLLIAISRSRVEWSDGGCARVETLTALYLASACAVAAAVLLWRTGRSRFGELHYIAR